MTPLNRRSMLSSIAAVVTGAWLAPRLRAQGKAPMYGLIGKMTAVAGQRDVLASMLLDSTQAMPGCLSYVIATDPADAP